MEMTLHFLGAAGTVTGSKFLLSAGPHQWLVDCGLFQGYRELRDKNWSHIPVNPTTLNGVLLTHAHIDHSGYLPVLVKNGYSGPIYTTPATADLCRILLPDSGYLQEKDAEFANRHGFSRHRPAKPLYTRLEAENSLTLFKSIAFNKPQVLAAGLTTRFYPAGHILGAAIIRLDLLNGETLVFSGDLGRTQSDTMLAPTPVEQADYLVIESTYGNRKHEHIEIEDALGAVLTDTAKRGGTVIIPAFAVGRAQSLLHHISQLKRRRRIPDLPVFLDSPMAINASELFCEHLESHRLSASQCKEACDVATYVRSTEDSKALTANRMPKIIISASGMAMGGRIVHHIMNYASDPRNTLLFTGFQAAGTRGRAIVDGANSVKIHGRDVPIRASVYNLETLSAHADADEIIDWLGQFKSAPKITFIVHGEPNASAALKSRIERELGWYCKIPALGEMAVLT